MTPFTTEVQLYRGKPKLLESAAFQAHVVFTGGAAVLQDNTPVC
jgi:hypothetical protein